MAKLKRGPKLLIMLTVFGAPLAWLGMGVHSGKIKLDVLKTVVPSKADAINAQVIEGGGSTKQLPLPGNSPMPQCIDGNTSNCLPHAPIKVKIWAWNANMALLLANGGAQTIKGSLMAKHGVNVLIERQDDTGIMKSELLSMVQQLASNPNADGTRLITIMGDGSAQFFHDLNPLLARVCADCTAETFATIGYSRGEDGFWGPAEWAANARAIIGRMIIGVLRDGDWNIAMKWMGQNNIPNNPDDKVYDPKAVNWVNASSYTEAVKMLITPGGYCVDLPVKGDLTGKRQHICASGVVTWTPGDVTLATKKGGLVPILTTRESAFQMPCVLIGSKRWIQAHSSEVDNLLAATYEAAGQIRAFPAALQKAGEISAAVYKEQNADYWVRYYRGTTQPDATGQMVQLGGSSVATLADALQSFGLSGGTNLFAAAYNTFGKIVVQQYPKDYPNFPPVSEILDTSHVLAVKAMNTLRTDNGESQAYTRSTAPMAQVEGRRNYSIQFATGSATILPASFETLNQLSDDISITRYIAAVNGYTDATGNPDSNMELSRQRAESVKVYLAGHGVANVLRVYPHGDQSPVGDNATAAGRAMNRRVEIVLGTVANQ